MIQRCSPFYCIILSFVHAVNVVGLSRPEICHTTQTVKNSKTILYIYSAPAVRCAVVTEQIAAITNRQTKFNDVIDYFSV